MNIYRKIYIENFGPIPLDEDGRTYDIHHIDGNRNNNDPSNLIALSIQDHYNTHHQQQDWMACYRIGQRMLLSPEQISHLAKLNAKKRVEDGTHNFLGSENNNKKVINKTNPFLKRPDGSSAGRDINRKLVSEGKHTLLKRPDGSSVGGEISRQRVKDKTHQFLTREDGTNLQHDRLKNGTHNLFGGVTCYDKQGNVVQISKEHYHSQTGPKKDWEWVHNRSKEAKERLGVK